MAKAKIAVVIVILALLQVSCATARKPDGGSGGTSAVMTVNGFQKGESGGGPAACDGQYHSDGDLIAALSTVWFAGGSMCHRQIRITNSLPNGLNLVAEVVDQCDTQSGCKDNMIATSKRVWDALGLDSNIGVVPVTWSDA